MLTHRHFAQTIARAVERLSQDPPPQLLLLYGRHSEDWLLLDLNNVPQVLQFFQFHDISRIGLLPSSACASILSHPHPAAIATSLFQWSDQQMIDHQLCDILALVQTVPHSPTATEPQNGV